MRRGNRLICEKCGLDNPGDFRFCPRCGAVLEKRAKVDHSRIKTQKEAIIKIIQTRNSTDTIITTSWIWVMIAVYVMIIIVSTVIGFSAVFDFNIEDPASFSEERLFEKLRDQLWIATVLEPVFYVMAAVLGYMLVSRLNRHFKRDREMRNNIISLLTVASSSAESGRAGRGDVEALSRIDDGMNYSEKERYPLVWAFVVAVPSLVGLVQYAVLMNSDSYHDYRGYSLLLSAVTYVSYIPLFYLSYFLSKSIFNHHTQWSEFAGLTSSTAYRLGFKEVRPDWPISIESKSYVLFILATILTAGLFMFYWWYTLILDPNRHMKGQWVFEDNLVKAISD